MRLQQLTGPVMAKGLEDTVFYRYYPLASLNEVGGRPTTGPTEIERFHVFCARRWDRWPHALSATATHDTKRGEDTRARLDVLSEIPREWMETVKRWQRMNRRAKPVVDEARVPGTNEEYLLYQTLLGVWPLEALERELTEAEHRALEERVGAYLMKALREAKLHTSWININEPYEKACAEFLRHLLDRNATGNPFLADLQRFLPRVAIPGIYNSLAQLVLKVTAPGVPDLYQGTELWDFALVDPDNRRPVDYAERRAPSREARAPGRGGAAGPDRRGPRASGRRHAQAAGDDARPHPPASPSRPLRGRRLSSARCRGSPRAPRRGLRPRRQRRPRRHQRDRSVLCPARRSRAAPGRRGALGAGRACCCRLSLPAGPTARSSVTQRSQQAPIAKLGCRSGESSPCFRSQFSNLAGRDAGTNLHSNLRERVDWSPRKTVR